MERKQNAKYDTAYSKLNTKDSSNDDANEGTELFNEKPTFKEIPTAKITLEENDTLQALSIRYNCSIEELKRLNNIHEEDKIFARTIKVPFTAALAGIHRSGKALSEDTGILVEDLLNIKLDNTLTNLPNTSKNKFNFNEVIFNSNIISKPYDITNDEVNEICDEEDKLLSQELPTPEPIVSKLSCSGADADLSLFALIICIVIVIFLVPLIYVLELGFISST